jgi:hypothetical protein
MDHLQPLTGIDPQIVEAAMNRARKERSDAFWSIMKAVFGRKAGLENSASPPRRMPSSAQVC